ncbi:MAG TPA: PfkB family carbohydrate kinase [Ignavibacteriaceae bacterium]|nr:PfkB family carbohydrate kinase [Ignavibacteriaceae bacterium]
MVLTVTLNPLLERRYNYMNVTFNAENRDGSLVMKAGGKGINVSRQLNNLSVENIGLTFLGGSNGKLLKEILVKENIKISSIRTENNTREASIIIDESSKGISTFFSLNSKITSIEVEEFKSKIDKMIQNCEIVVFAGSSPCEETDSIFPFGIEIANRYDKISILDTYGRHFNACIESKPTIIHNNISEVEKSYSISIKDENDKIDLLNKFYQKQIKQVYLTDGGNEISASNFDFHFKAIPPRIQSIDPTGSGDAFVAGVIYGLTHDLTFEDTFQTAVSLGSLNANRFEVCTVSLEEVERLKANVIIQPIGKRMKTLDVSPN